MTSLKVVLACVTPESVESTLMRMMLNAFMFSHSGPSLKVPLMSVFSM